MREEREQFGRRLLGFLNDADAGRVAPSPTAARSIA
jgi:hypothetical protein